MRHWSVAMTLFVTCCGPAFAAQNAHPPKPDLLFILSDDQNPDTLGCLGGKVLTPTRDKRCAEGVKFTRAYNSSSVCTPSRYTCTTGQFLRACPPGTPSDVGFNVQVEPGRWNVARVLREHGYWTGFVGKWHTGHWDADQLYGLQADPGERVNLIRDPQSAQTVAELRGRLKGRRAALERPFGEFVP